MASTGQAADPELSNAFAELSMKKIQAEGQIRLCNAQIESLSRKIQHSQLVQSEIKSLPPDINMYKTIGRMFALQSQDTIKGDLEDKEKSYAEKIKALESSKEYLQRNVEEFKNSVRELVMSKQSAR